MIAQRGLKLQTSRDVCPYLSAHQANARLQKWNPADHENYGSRSKVMMKVSSGIVELLRTSDNHRNLKRSQPIHVYLIFVDRTSTLDIVDNTLDLHTSGIDYIFIWIELGVGCNLHTFDSLE